MILLQRKSTLDWRSEFLSVRKASGTPFTSSALWSVKLPRFDWTCKAILLQKTYVPPCTSISHLCSRVTKKQSGRHTGLALAGTLLHAGTEEGNDPEVYLGSQIGNLGFLWTHPHTFSWEGWADFICRQRNTRMGFRRRGKAHTFIRLVSQSTNEQVKKYMMWCQMLWRKMHHDKR